MRYATRDIGKTSRVVDQWAYHTRLYESAAFVAEHPELELVQLNSLAVELMRLPPIKPGNSRESGTYLYMFKIDEISNLGAVRIRLRSLKVAMDERMQQAAEEANRQLTNLIKRLWHKDRMS